MPITPLEPILIFWFFVLGAVAASFIGLVTARLYTGASLIYGHSTCDACGAPLPPQALIPILSWLIYKGTCFICKARFGVASPVTELVLGTLFALSYLKLGLTAALPLFLVALVLLAGLVLYDLLHGILPPVLLWLFVGAALLCAIASAPDLMALAFTAYVALFIGSMFGLLNLLSGGRALGLADAPLVCGLALLVGGDLAFSGLIFSFWIGGVIGIILLAARARGTKINSEVPFAPFLAAGFLLAYFTSWDAFTLVGQALNVFLL